MELSKKVRKRISERTGLKNEDEIKAYAHFCHHSDTNDGVIMYGDVQYEIYRGLLEESSLPMQVLEESYRQSVGENLHLFTNESRRDLASPLFRKAKQEFERFYQQFIEKGLVSPPEKINLSESYYPRLRAYNYFNDPEFFHKNQRNNLKK